MSPNRITITALTSITAMYFSAKVGLLGKTSIIIDRDRQFAKMIPHIIAPNQVEITTHTYDIKYSPNHNKRLYPMPMVDGKITSIRPIEISYCRIYSPEITLSKMKDI